MPVLALDQRLPLTCTREGCCCHGKLVRVNPWELACLALARALSARCFRDTSTEEGGTRLRCDGPAGWSGLPACSQYRPGLGCLGHVGRPLACRLYPLGRELRLGGEVRYVHDGSRLPCLEACPGVAELPALSVADYLVDQGVAAGEAAQDACLELAQDLAEVAFVVWQDSPLRSQGVAVLGRWRALCRSDAVVRVGQLPPIWLDRLMLPELEHPLEDAAGWVAAHRAALQTAMQAEFAVLREPSALLEASAIALGLALHLAESCGAEVRALGRAWLDRAEGLADQGAEGRHSSSRRSKRRPYST